MKKLWMQAAANIKKTKSTSITLGILFLVAAILINTGLLVTINYGDFFSNTKKELNTSDAYFSVPDSLYNDNVKSYFESNEHVEQTQINSALWLEANVHFKDNNETQTIIMNNMDDKREISKWKFAGKHLEEEGLSVYVPDIYNAVGGYDLNDKITLNYKDGENNEEKELILTIKGFTEDVFFSSTDTGMMGFYLPEKSYEQVSDILSDEKYQLNLVFANLDSVDNVSKVEKGLREILGIDSTSLMAGDSSKMMVAIDIELIELSRCMMASMIAVMMVLFACIIVIVCLLVVRFRIINTLEDEIMKIGSLKSIGYTNKQIIVSVMMQFLTISGLGTILGIGLSYPLLPPISVILEQQSGLRWVQGFDPLISCVTFIALIGIVALVTFFVAGKVKNLTPVAALRGETTGKKYKKNHLELQSAKGNLSVILSIKSIIQNVKQNLMIIVILIAVTFAGAYGVIMYYNTTVDTTAFAEVPGFEITNAIVALDTNQNQEEAVETIKNMDNVTKVQFLDEAKVTVGDTEAACYIMDTYQNRQTKLVYEGRYPEKSGEVAIAGILADRINKKPGDKITITSGDNSIKLKITGLTNGSSMGGINMCVLTDDYLKLVPSYRKQLLYVYLEKGTDAGEFIKKVEQTLPKDMVRGTTNFDKEMEEGMASYQNIVKAMGIAMFAITIFVIILVLYFVISSSIIRKKRELGIQKAIGFTTIQLMNQISLSFVIPVFIGTAIGCILGAVYTNPLMSIAMRSIGIMRANFIIDIPSVVLFSFVILLFSYLLSLLITWRIRKISAYTLVTE